MSENTPSKEVSKFTPLRQPTKGTTSKFTAEQYLDEAGAWRVRIRSIGHCFDDKAKAIFLEEYRKHGRMGHSSAAAGTTVSTVRKHLEKDPEFALGCLEAEEEYRSRLVAHHQNLVFEGTVKETFDRNGNLVNSERVYPIRLIELELKKHDEGYRDTRNVNMDMKVTGGVLVAPAEVKSIDDWENMFNKDAPEVIEVVAEPEK